MKIRKSFGTFVTFAKMLTKKKRKNSFLYMVVFAQLAPSVILAGVGATWRSLSQQVLMYLSPNGGKVVLN